MSENKEYIIPRSKWLRGGMNGNGEQTDAVMCDNSGQKCCLGHVMFQDGISEDVLRGNGEPYAVADDIIEDNPNEFEDSLLVHVESEHSDFCDEEHADEWEELQCTCQDYTILNTDLSDCAMDINDDKSITEEEREKELKELFAKYGVDIKFVD